MTGHAQGQYATLQSATTTPGAQILYIVGNGFDLHHGLRSSYVDFGTYLSNVDTDTYDVMRRCFTLDDDFWWRFESQLAHLDTDALLDDAASFLPSYGAEDWSDSGHHDYEYELDKVVEAISTTLQDRFTQWVRQINIPPAERLTGKLLQLRRDARYLTFNYTDTLQRVYGVPDANVIHIHGASGRLGEKLILGHGWLRTAADSFNFYLDPESADVRVMAGNDIIDGYFSATFKPTARVVEAHRLFFQSLEGVRRVFVMGHSLADVDLPYLTEVRAHLGAAPVQWQVSFHSNPSDAEARMRDIGLPGDHVGFVPLAAQDQWSCP